MPSKGVSTSEPKGSQVASTEQRGNPLISKAAAKNKKRRQAKKNAEKATASQSTSGASTATENDSTPSQDESSVSVGVWGYELGRGSDTDMDEDSPEARKAKKAANRQAALEDWQRAQLRTDKPVRTEWGQKKKRW